MLLVQYLFSFIISYVTGAVLVSLSHQLCYLCSICLALSSVMLLVQYLFSFPISYVTGAVFV